MDTLKLRCGARILPWQEMKTDGEIQWKQKGRDYFHKNIPVGNGCILKLEASNYCGKGYISAEVSAPKLLLGSNVEMVTADDLEYFPDTMTELVNRHTRIPFEASEAIITRLDLAHNWQTGSESNAHAYRDAMRGVHFSKRYRQWICSDGFEVDSIYWANKSQEILLYPKFAETQKLARDNNGVGARFIERSRGMLRLEHRWLNPKTVKEQLEKFGYGNRAGDVITHLLEVTNETIERDMKTLGLNNQIEIRGERQRADILRERCGGNTEKYQKLLGFLTDCDMYGENNLVALGHINVNTFGTRKTELKKMGISLARSSAAYVLPPLPAPKDAKPFNKSKNISPRRILSTYTGNNAVSVEGVF